LWYILDPFYRAVGFLSNDIPAGLSFLNHKKRETLLNGYSTMTFDIFNKDDRLDLLENEGFILIPGKTRNQHDMYRIKNIQESHGNKDYSTIFCETAATSDLLGSRIRPVKYGIQNLSQIARSLLANTGWELDDYFNDELISIEYNEYPTALDAIQQLAATCSAEIEFKIYFDGIDVVKKVVNFHEKRGDDNGVSFEYDFNLINVTREIDTSEMVTAIIGIGKEDKNGTKITMANATATPKEPFKIIGDMVVDEDALDEWFFDDRHREGIFSDSNAISPNELYYNSLAELKKKNKPRITYTVDVLSLEEISGFSHLQVDIGDTVIVKDRTFRKEIFLNARVLEKESSVTDPDKDVVILGEYVLLNVKPITMVQKLQDKINLRQDEWNLAAQKAAEALEAAKDAQKNIQYKIQILSTNGDIFRNGVVNTTVFAKVYKGNEEITKDLTPSNFIWKKFNKDGTEDIAWGNAHAGIGDRFLVKSEDIVKKCTFTCDLDIIL